MKFAPDVLLEVLSIVQEGLLLQTDVSERLRAVEVMQDPNDAEKLILSESYVLARLKESEKEEL